MNTRPGHPQAGLGLEGKGLQSSAQLWEQQGGFGLALPTPQSSSRSRADP